MKAFIIDDEAAPRLILKHLLNQLDCEVNVVGEATNLKDGVEAISRMSIDVLFLDIEMPQHKGIEIHQLFPGEVEFDIVFVTAYSKYAIQAFKLAAFDYLLKPIKLQELSETLARLEKKQGRMRQQLSVLSSNLLDKDNQSYLLRTHKEEFLIQVNSIVSLEADGMYTHLVLKEKKITASKPMKEILADLPSYFFRSHRSYAVNLHQIEIPVRIRPEGIKTSVGTFVPLSVRNKQQFIVRANSLSKND